MGEFPDVLRGQIWGHFLACSWGFWAWFLALGGWFLAWEGWFWLWKGHILSLRAYFRSERVDYRLGRANVWSERVYLGSNRADLGPEGATYGSRRADLRAKRGPSRGGIDGRTNIWKFTQVSYRTLIDPLVLLPKKYLRHLFQLDDPGPMDRRVNGQTKRLKELRVHY